MMCIVAQEHQFVALYLEVETSVNTSVCLHSVFQFLLRATIKLCHSHSCNTVVDIYGHRLTEFHVLHILYWRHEVKGDTSVGNADILGMEVTTVTAVCVASYSRLQLLLHLQSLVDYECSTRLYQRRIVAETFEISLLSAIYVEMIRVGGSDYRHPWREPMEGAVELICLNHHIVAVAQDIVGAIVFGYASEECIAIEMALMHDMCTHWRGCCLTVSTGEAQSLVRLCQCTEHLCALLCLKAALTEILQFLMLFRDCRCIYDKTRPVVATSLRYLFHILFVMYQGTLFFQLLREL